jgi:hypothetical protein
MLETSIAYLLSMEWGRDITVPPSSSFSLTSSNGSKDVTFYIIQATLGNGIIRFVPMSTSKEFIVMFVWNKKGDNCVTIPTAKIQDDLPTGVITPKKIAESFIHKTRIDVSSDFLPSGNDFIYQRQAKDKA